jgi:uncharacterized protein YlzI (FlbEa/FlbD family)
VIALSKLDGSTMYLNEDLVERVEGGVTTAIHLTNGNYLIVRDDVDAVLARIRDEKSTVLAGAVEHSLGTPRATMLTAVPSEAEMASERR